MVQLSRAPFFERRVLRLLHGYVVPDLTIGLSNTGIAQVQNNSLRGTTDSRLVVAWDGAEGDIDAISTIDGDDCQRELHKLLFTELRSRKRKNVIRNVAVD